MRGILFPMQSNGEEKSSIERLKKKLYTREDDGSSSHERRTLREQYYDVGDRWAKEVEPSLPPDPFPMRKRSSALSSILIAAIIFFVLSVGVSFFLFFCGGNLVSS